MYALDKKTKLNLWFSLSRAVSKMTSSGKAISLKEIGILCNVSSEEVDRKIKKHQYPAAERIQKLLVTDNLYFSSVSRMQ